MQEHTVVDVLIVGEYETSFAGGERFGTVHAECGGPAKGTDLTTIDTGTVGVGAVFEELQPVDLGEPSEALDLRRQAPHVSYHNGFSLLGDVSGKFPRIEVAGWVAVGQDRDYESPR